MKPTGCRREAVIPLLVGHEVSASSDSGPASSNDTCFDSLPPGVCGVSRSIRSWESATLCPATSSYQRLYRYPLVFTMPPPRWNHGHHVLPDASQDDPDPSLLPASQPQPPLPPPSTLERPKQCINRFPTPAFSLLCTMMDRMRNEDPGKRRETLSRFMALWRIKVGNDLYPLVRLLLPDVSGFWRM